MNIRPQKLKGFTLIEVMLVIALIGLMASVIQFTTGDNQQLDKLKKASTRFAATFDIAAEYGLLNNIELGVFIDKNSYQFLAYDGVTWNSIDDNDVFNPITLAEEISLTLTLDDLPIEDALLTNKTFSNQDDDLEVEDNKKAPTPQLYILSGGDITPFTLIFSFSDDFADNFTGNFTNNLQSYENNGDQKNIGYSVTGLYYTPLTIKGPNLVVNN